MCMYAGSVTLRKSFEVHGCMGIYTIMEKLASLYPVASSVLGMFLESYEAERLFKLT